MDKNKIKSFAIWARRSLIKSVSEKAYSIGIYEDKILESTAVQGGFKLEGKEEIFTLSKKDRDALVKQVNEKGFEQVMEEVAYTWFNRFMGLRYMEVNDYLPTGVRILSSEVEEKKEPDVLTKVSEIIDELNLNANEIYNLLDTGNTLDREKAYRIILVKQCNELGKIIPQMFEKISDYTELLLPDNLLEEGSVIRKMVKDIEESDWREEVEIIGWMYQYYISEKKDEVFAALKKNVKITKENIPAATQLFTPKWIVKYMVENSLGRLWLEGHPNEELQREFKYYLEEAEQEQEVEEELKKIREEHSKLKPEDIKVLDPCMGSGHILVYAFDVLYEIYKTAGYSEREIPRMILQNNLYGLDIDDRAAQLASFALIMKARHYNRRLFREIEREHLELNLCAIQESNRIDKEVIDYFCSLNTELDNEELKNDLEYLCTKFTDAKEYGSILEVKKVNFDALNQRLREIEQEDNLIFGDYRAILLEKVSMIIKQSQIMSKMYDVCVTNPPYMGRKGMGSKLSLYIDKDYKDSSNDLFTVFIERGFKYIKKNMFNVTVTMQSWMYLSVYETLREKVISNKTIDSLLHMGNMVMGIAFGTSATIFRNSSIIRYKGTYTNINMEDLIEGKPSEFPIPSKVYRNLSMMDFNNIPSKPIAYDVTLNILNIYKSNKMIKDYGDTKTGMTTGDNERFLRLWYEVKYQCIGFNNSNAESAKNSQKRWFPYSKGGGFRRWVGFNQYIVNWYNDGKEIKDNVNDKGKKVASVRSENKYFRECITWSAVTSYKFSARFIRKGYLFDSGGSSLFVSDNLYYYLGLLNSKISQMFLDISNNTINYQPGDIAKIPIINKKVNDISKIVRENIIISKQDWDSFETSWDFKIHPLIKFLDEAKDFKLSSSFEVWESKCKENFNQLKANEEELNRIFIDIYGLQDELTPEVDDKDVTIRKADRERDIKSFISYAVGCMVGRYSADVSFVVEKKDDGYHGVHSDNIDTLIYAGGDFNDKWSLEEKKVRRIVRDEKGIIISDSWTDAHFVPDADNIIPITEDEYFEDDIVSRFIDFVKLYFGAEDLEGNLDFIADSIGRKPSETARQAIRRYFIKDFYKDHLKVYQKRPIYWMFESGKNDGFKCLVYMHRYNEQTVAKVRTDYLHTLQRKYEAEINRLQLVVDSDEYTAKDRTAAKKKIDRISKQIEECREYDQVVAYLANEKISIDLDDGVKVNYAKFQDIKVINSKGKETKMNLLAKN
jgi:hypothetical protein